MHTPGYTLKVLFSSPRNLKKNIQQLIEAFLSYIFCIQIAYVTS